jgi:hypothetical protein
MTTLKAKLAPHFRLKVPHESGKYGSRWSNEGMLLGLNIPSMKPCLHDQISTPSLQRNGLGDQPTTGHIGAAIC